MAGQDRQTDRKDRYRAFGDLLRTACAALPAPGARGDGDVALLTGLAAVFRTIGAHGEADGYYSAALDIVPNSRAALLGRVDMALAMGDSDTALVRADAALDHLPDDPLLQERRANALLRAGQAAAAVSQLEALRMRKGGGPVRARLLLARVYRARSDFDAAKSVYDDILQSDPGHPAAHMGRIDTAGASGDLQAALEYADAALAAVPGDPQLQERRAVALLRLRRGTEAAEQFAALMEAGADDPDRMRLLQAKAHRSAANYAAAAEIYEGMQTRGPARRTEATRTEAALGRIDVALSVGDTGLADKLSKRAMKKWPQDLSVAVRRLRTLRAMGRHDRAIDMLQARLAEAPDDTVLRLELARTHIAAGTPDAADAIFAEILADEAEHRGATLGRVKLAETQGDLQSALSVLERRLAGFADEKEAR